MCLCACAHTYAYLKEYLIYSSFYSPPLSFSTSLISEPVIDGVDIVRINSTAFNMTVQVQYTGGGRIFNIIVSFRVLGEQEWSEDMFIPAKAVSDSNSLEWNGIVVNSMFETFSIFEFRVSLSNEARFTSAAAIQQEIQGAVLLYKMKGTEVHNPWYYTILHTHLRI